MRFIYVKFQREGIHCYPVAGTDPKLADVSFLAHPHRHMFWFEVCIEVFHQDRDLEFIQFKRWLEGLYSQDILELDNQSCEMIADSLMEKIQERYPNRCIQIDVSEDGENGAIVTN